MGFAIRGETIFKNIFDVFRDIRFRKNKTNSGDSIEGKFNSPYIHSMNSRNIITAILCGFLLTNCSQNKTSSPPEDTYSASVIAPQKSPLVKLHLTVIDCNLDTLNDELPLEMDSLFSSDEFQTEGHYTISYEQFQQLDPHITNQDMAQYGIQNSHYQKGFQKWKIPEIQMGFCPKYQLA